MTKSKTLNKIVAVIITLAMLISIIPMTVTAESEKATVYDYEIELLEKLQVVPAALTSKLDSKITRGQFSEMLTAMIGVGGGGNAMEELFNLGIVHGYGDGTLLEDNSITTYEAVKMLINTLGYETLAELEGGYPLGYVKIAYDIDLLGGGVQNKEMTVADAIRLLVDAGNSPVAKVSNDSLLGGVSLGGKTMFYTYYDVVKVEGLVTANGFTSLDTKTCIPGEVLIGGTNYEVGDTAAADLFGYHVEAYVIDTDLTDVILAVGPKSDYNNVVTTMAGTYVQTTGNLDSFTVQYENEEGALKKLKTESGYYVIYNGKLYGGLTLAMLDSSVADVTYIDNDRDGMYEIIIIESYETYVVEATNSSKYDVFAKYDKSINLDPDRKDVFIFKDSNTLAEFADITAGTVISVLESEDGNFVKAYILSKTVTGTVDSISTAGGLTYVGIGGQKLCVSNEFENLVHADKQNLAMGVNVTVVLDRNGNIVETQLIGDVWTYGFVTRVGYDDSKEVFSTIEIFDQSNKFVTLSLGERVMVDGTSYKNLDLITAGLCEQEGGSYPKGVRQLVRYKAEGGALKSIDTEYYNQELEGEDSLQAYSIAVDDTANYSKNSGYIYSGNDVLYGADDTTTLFTIPTDATEKDAAYYTAQKFTSLSDKASVSNVKVYTVNEAKIAKVAVRYAKDNKRAGSTNDYVIVKSVETIINKDGEAVNKVTGVTMSSGANFVKEATVRNKDTSALYIANKVLETTNFGDCIRVRTVSIPDYGSVLWSAYKTFGSNDAVGTTLFSDVATSVAYADTYVSAAREYVGYITFADKNYMMIENSDGTAMVPFKTTGAKIYLVDCADETITTIDPAAVVEYAALHTKVVVVTRNGSIFGAVIYANAE